MTALRRLWTLTIGMKTIYDWLTVLIFAALVTRFLQQSVAARDDGDSIWHYLLPCLGCAAANWLGNDGLHWAAVGMIAATVGYILVFLRPFSRPR